jgi:hypothetical protein
MSIPSEYRLLVQVGHHEVLNIAIGAIDTEKVLPPDLAKPEMHTVVVKTLNKVENILFFASLEMAQHFVLDIKHAKDTHEDVSVRLEPDLNQHLLHPNDRAQ